MAVYFSSTKMGFFDSRLFTSGSIPDDAVEISEDQYKTLLSGQSAGKRISCNSAGAPVLVDPSPSKIETVKSQIVALEATATPRRLREAALGIDNGWLADLEAQIDALRAQLGT